jgi:hypothetical protein
MPNYQTIDSRQIPSTQYATPTTGSTVTVNSTGFVNLLINPAGTLATLTITLPVSPTDGDVVQLSSTQIVTALTMSGGTIIGALTALAVATFASYMYHATTAEWWRIG